MSFRHEAIAVAVAWSCRPLAVWDMSPFGVLYGLCKRRMMYDRSERICIFWIIGVKINILWRDLVTSGCTHTHCGACRCAFSAYLLCFISIYLYDRSRHWHMELSRHWVSVSCIPIVDSICNRNMDPIQMVISPCARLRESPNSWTHPFHARVQCPSRCVCVELWLLLWQTMVYELNDKAEC